MPIQKECSSLTDLVRMFRPYKIWTASFNETKNRLKVPADTAAALTLQ